MTYSFCIDSRYTSGGNKSLSSIIGKNNVYGNLTYDMYSQLYDACVILTMMYGADVVGYINHSNFEKTRIKKNTAHLQFHLIQAIIILYSLFKT